MIFSHKLEIDIRKEEIKKTIPLTRFFNEIGLQESDKRYICPFHNDAHPSLTIKEDIWSCWACNLIGLDIIGFVERYYNLNFIKSIEFLENKYGLNGAKGIDFSTPIKNKIKKNRKEIIFFIDKVEDKVSNLVKCSKTEYQIRDRIFKKLDRMYIKMGTLNFENDDDIFKFKNRLIDFQNRIEEVVINE
jgi:hypothetical protein